MSLDSTNAPALSPEVEVESNEIPNMNSPFRQQKVPACKPFLTPFLAACIYGAFSLISLILGASILTSSKSLYEEVQDYTDCNESKCKLHFNLTTDVSKLFVYYQLEGFHQNHQAYAKSKSWNQLKYAKLSDKETTCEPMREIGGKQYLPCGSVPSSYFNDIITIENNYNLSETGITHKEYKRIFTNNVTKNVKDISKYEVVTDTVDLTNEHVANWFLISPTSQTRKLYGVINQEIPKGTSLTVSVVNNYPHGKSYTYKKQIVLGTTNFLGGKNPFFGIFFVVLCVLSAVAAVIFLVLYFFNVLPLYQCRKQASRAMDIPLIP